MTERDCSGTSALTDFLLLTETVSLGGFAMQPFPLLVTLLILLGSHVSEVPMV